VSVAKALLFRQKAAESKSHGDLQGIELAVNILEKQLKGLDDMETWTSTIQSNGAKIAKEIEKIRETANVQIEQLRVLPERTQTGGVGHEESSPTTLSGKAIHHQLRISERRLEHAGPLSRCEPGCFSTQIAGAKRTKLQESQNA
jgi:hypothetical protein